MYCPKCYRLNDDANETCVNCGHKLHQKPIVSAENAQKVVNTLKTEAQKRGIKDQIKHIIDTMSPKSRFWLGLVLCAQGGFAVAGGHLLVAVLYLVIGYTLIAPVLPQFLPNALPKKVIAVIFIAALLIGMCISGGFSSSSRSSGRKWSDLSETEKNNARWAYYAQQAINDRKSGR